ncbi:MAG: TetR/AcrR family transcriptional regulator [Chitinophagaceae bacterium]|nr:MAG: TetR/AcrR family transcriptional regulator [Chitinophagaceae bacterium]
MSKSKVHTQQKILDKALEMFNERGIEYVGLRELAAVLGIRVGNITYYFPTKDDLVFALSAELSKSNGSILVTDENLTITGFLETQYKLFQNQQRFRCLLLSFVHIMTQNKKLADVYKHTQNKRLEAFRKNIRTLAAKGYLKLQQESQADVLVSALSLIGRFWISEAAISFRNLTGEQQVRHYINLIANLFLPFASARGKKDIKTFLKEFQPHYSR